MQRHSRLRLLLLCIPLLGAACGDVDGSSNGVTFDPDKSADASLPVVTPPHQDDEPHNTDDEPNNTDTVPPDNVDDSGTVDAQVDENDASFVADAGLDSAVGTQPDAGDAGDAGRDAGSDAGTTPASTDKLFVLTLSLTGHDRFYDVTYGADGSIFAVGSLSSDTSGTADHALMVAKFKPDGSLETSFGSRGVVVRNVAVGGTNREIGRSVVVQSTGQVVIAGTVEHDPKDTTQTARDTDWVVVRFTATGALDSTFGTKGIAQLDLSTGYPSVDGTEVSLLGRDQLSTLTLGPNDTLLRTARHAPAASRRAEIRAPTRTRRS